MYHCGSRFVNPKIKRFSYGLDREKSIVKIRAGLWLGWDWIGTGSGLDRDWIGLCGRLLFRLDPIGDLTDGLFNQAQYLGGNLVWCI